MSRRSVNPGEKRGVLVHPVQEGYTMPLHPRSEASLDDDLEGLYGAGDYNEVDDAEYLEAEGAEDEYTIGQANAQEVEGEFGFGADYEDPQANARGTGAAEENPYDEDIRKASRPSRFAARQVQEDAYIPITQQVGGAATQPIYSATEVATDASAPAPKGLTKKSQKPKAFENQGGPEANLGVICSVYGEKVTDMLGAYAGGFDFVRKNGSPVRLRYKSDGKIAIIINLGEAKNKKIENITSETAVKKLVDLLGLKILPKGIRVTDEDQYNEPRGAVFDDGTYVRPRFEGVSPRVTPSESGYFNPRNKKGKLENKPQEVSITFDDYSSYAEPKSEAQEELYEEVGEGSAMYSAIQVHPEEIYGGLSAPEQKEAQELAAIFSRSTRVKGAHSEASTTEDYEEYIKNYISEAKESKVNKEIVRSIGQISKRSFDSEHIEIKDILQLIISSYPKELAGQDYRNPQKLKQANAKVASRIADLLNEVGIFQSEPQSPQGFFSWLRSGVSSEVPYSGPQNPQVESLNPLGIAALAAIVDSKDSLFNKQIFSKVFGGKELDEELAAKIGTLYGRFAKKIDSSYEIPVQAASFDDEEAVYYGSIPEEGGQRSESEYMDLNPEDFPGEYPGVGDESEIEPAPAAPPVPRRSTAWTLDATAEASEQYEAPQKNPISSGSRSRPTVRKDPRGGYYTLDDKRGLSQLPSEFGFTSSAQDTTYEIGDEEGFGFQGLDASSGEGGLTVLTHGTASYAEPKSAPKPTEVLAAGGQQRGRDSRS